MWKENINRICNEKGRIFVWVVVLFAILIRVLWMCDYLKTDAFPFRKDGDSQAFLWKAKDIAAGDLFRKDLNTTWPFYVYFLGSLLKLFSGSLFSVILIQQLLGVANCVLIYLIGRKLFDETAGLIAGLLCTAYIYFPFYESMLMYTSLSIFLVSLLFLLMLNLRDTQSLRRFLSTGVIFGIAVLTQANVLIFGFLAIGWVLWQKREPLAKSARYFFVFLAGFLSIVSIQIARDSIAHGTVTVGPQVLGVNFFIGNNPKAKGTFFCPLDFTDTQKGICRDAKAIARGTLRRDLSDSEVSQFWVGKAVDFIGRNPHLYLRLVYEKLKAAFAPDEFVVEHEWRFIRNRIWIAHWMFNSLRWIMPFAMLGIVLSLRMFRKVFLLFAVAAVLVLIMLLFFVMAKHRLMLVPFLAIFAGHGIAVFLERLKQKRYVPLCFFSMLLVGAFFLFGYSLNEVKANSTEDLNLGWVRERLLQLEGYLDHARYQDAAAGLAELERVAPDNRFVAFDTGVAAFLTGDLNMAEKKFTKAVEIFPYYVDALYNLGLIYNKEGRYQDAESVLARAAFLDPEDVRVSFEWALSLKSLGRREEAKKEFNENLKDINRWRMADIALVQSELENLEAGRV